MSVKRKSIVVSFVALLSVIAGVIGLVPSLNAQNVAHAATAQPAQVHAATAANGPYTVQGNKILDANGNPYLIHGVGRDGLEYDCNGDNYLTPTYLQYMGAGTNNASGVYWYANTVRLPLSEGFWLHGAANRNCTASGYQALVSKVVGYITALHMNVMLDLQWTDAGGQSGDGGGPWALADSDSVTFWQQVATAYKNNPDVMFEIFNEPHPASWSCWLNGCPVTKDTSYSNDCGCTKTVAYTGVGMQALVNAVRGTGANNLVIVGGMNWAFDLSQVPTYTVTGGNVVYDTHPYNYSDKQPGTWSAAFGNISQTYPVVSAESGEYDCGIGFMSQLLNYLESHNIGWIGWAWVLQGQPCTYPQLIMDYNGTPAQNMGYLIYQQLRTDAGQSVQPAPPISKNWYFAEGRVGAGFNEYLSLGNPDPLNSCNVQLKYLIEGGSPKLVNLTIPPASRVSESVVHDLGLASPSSTPAYSVSTVVTVTGGCNGIVAERPIYFNYHGINSGDDVMGATSLGTTFYFGDVPSGSGYTSYLTILNPQNTVATVTAHYYAGGKQVGTQSVQVPAQARGTIAPGAISLPTHTTAVVTSNQPVLVERPDYFSNISAGSAGTISGGSAVVGVQNLANDWLFAEGFTGDSNQPDWQEYLVIANVDPTNTPAAVTITLEPPGGATKVSTVTVNPMSQYIFNVNQAMPLSSVSADVSSTGAKIVVEREQFFHYKHTVSANNGFTIASSGGNDVIGQPGPASQTIYTFAEGYTAPGFNEWLTLQNPTGTSEAIYITLVNQLGQVYAAPAVVVGAHSRSTVDITQMVLQNLYSPSNHATAAVSMIVQSYAAGAVFVAERPEYWNYSGTQGGDDVIGY
ncbi:MAG TPA: cellulase family glycosylhydrolase [Ktedonobacteraceae bacterium]|nr:cellulase family glycosylhydrolase [Ktedonobacteraceae bacterium]